MLNPPAGSRIKTGPMNGGTLIEIPYPPAGTQRFFIVAFLLAWLGGWAFGFVFAFRQVLSGHAPVFLVFWLCAWTVGGAWAAYMTFCLIRPSEPERFVVGMNSLDWDSGRASVQWPGPWIYGYRPNGFIRLQQMFPRRMRIDFPRAALASMRLRDTGDGNRLTIDFGAQRLEIGRAATEIEREWLFGTLKRAFGIGAPDDRTDPPSGDKSTPM
jgi:hypothetical protein